MAPTVLKRPRPWDVIVIGSGATGGWAAHELGRRHLKVLVLEAGRDYDPLTGNVIAADGRRLTIGSTAGAQQVFGDESWTWLLLGPLSQ